MYFTLQGYIHRHFITLNDKTISHLSLVRWRLNVVIACSVFYCVKVCVCLSLSHRERIGVRTMLSMYGRRETYEYRVLETLQAQLMSNSWPKRCTPQRSWPIITTDRNACLRHRLDAGKCCLLLIAWLILSFDLANGDSTRTPYLFRSPPFNCCYISSTGNANCFKSYLLQSSTVNRGAPRHSYEDRDLSTEQCCTHASLMCSWNGYTRKWCTVP